MISKTTLILYILAILALSGFILYRHNEQKAWLKYALILYDDMVNCKRIMIKRNEGLRSYTQKYSYDYPGLKTKEIAESARQIIALMEKTLQSIEDIMAIRKVNHFNRTAFDFQHLLVAKEEQDVFRQKLYHFRDSLTLLMASDTAFTKQISDVCTIDEVLLTSARTHQKVMYIQGVELRLLTLVHQALTKLENKINSQTPIPDRVFPAISLHKPCIKAGEPFFGDMFSILYSSQYDSTLHFFINNQALPNEGGLGRVALPLQKARESLNLYIKIQNPVTNDYEIIKKTCIQEICKN
jgi:hypothetical protein